MDKLNNGFEGSESRFAGLVKGVVVCLLMAVRSWSARGCTATARSPPTQARRPGPTMHGPAGIFRPSSRRPSAPEAPIPTF